MNTPLQYLRLGLFQELEQDLRMNDDAYLNDNLDSNDWMRLYRQADRTSALSRYPYKLSFTAAIVVVTGTIQTVINSREYKLSRGQVLIVQPGSIVESLSYSPDFRSISLAFAESMDSLFRHGAPTDISVLMMRNAYPVTVYLDEVSLVQYLSLYKTVKQIYLDTEETLKSDVVKGFLLISSASFLSSVKNTLTDDFGQKDRGQALYASFMNDLRDFGTKEREVSFYAGRCCVCTKYFSRQIKAASGKTPREHIRSRVIVEAKALLNSTGYTVRQVSEALNFPSESSFCKYFREATGMSPGDFRKN